MRRNFKNVDIPIITSFATEEQQFTYIRQIPEVSKLLSSELFEVIELTNIEIVADIIVMVRLKIKVRSELPFNWKTLVKEWLVKDHNLTFSWNLKEDWYSAWWIFQTVWFFWNALQLVLAVPKYNSY